MPGLRFDAGEKEAEFVVKRAATVLDANRHKYGTRERHCASILMNLFMTNSSRMAQDSMRISRIESGDFCREFVGDESSALFVV